MFRELNPLETYEELSQKSDAVLIDCRAPAEWHFTGTPDLSQIGKKPPVSYTHLRAHET